MSPGLLVMSPGLLVMSPTRANEAEHIAKVKSEAQRIDLRFFISNSPGYERLTGWFAGKGVPLSDVNSFSSVRCQLCSLVSISRLVPRGPRALKCSLNGCSAVTYATVRRPDRGQTVPRGKWILGMQEETRSDEMRLICGDYRIISNKRFVVTPVCRCIRGSHLPFPPKRVEKPFPSHRTMSDRRSPQQRSAGTD